jgi:ribosomal protein L20A (L18A)
MAKNVFRVTGKFRAAHHEQAFSTEVVAASEAAAREWIFSILGSKHGAPRRLIHITNVETLKPDQVEDPVVRYAAGLTR